jgi:hypothetical protein
MKFARKKSSNSFVGLTYPKNDDQMREILEKEQSNFCAYSEVRLDDIQAAPELEHFYPKIHFPAQKDSYDNIYLVTMYMNRGKGSKGDTPPPPNVPYPKDAWNEVDYDPETFRAIPLDSLSALRKNNIQDLIDYLGLNRQKLIQARRAHCETIRELRKGVPNDGEFIDILVENPFEYLSYITLLDACFGLDLYSAFIGSQPPTP